MKYDDPEFRAEYRCLAQKLVRHIKEFGFDVLGLDAGYLIRSEAWNLKYGVHPSQPEFTLDHAETLIAQEFEKLYGVTPRAYGEFICREQMNDHRSLEAREAEAARLMPILQRIRRSED